MPTAAASAPRKLARCIRPTTTIREMPAPTSPAGTRAPRPVAALGLLCAGLTLVDVSMSSALLFCAHFFTEHGVIRALRVTGFEPSGRAACHPCPPDTA